ncbi:Probable polyketide biosynthesis zinc-dependent hydrolase BaeB [Chryseobacterium taklimakanense]|uniref:Probable polyketide biosynthesis zinc-dependent hydrolase BaeB n=1 Tax=Chryseobacterium taklimakanense TaxID=536441 RepID=A0A239XHU8_9FLAO|nr:MBL fold metallo-hydrolase [Chryseobacterium taklimakanense]SNV46439.1 Probable polyketide biosynthesis zinc-dependent hydrolase BaeB [Chryseobacterium taklimakanense]
MKVEQIYTGCLAQGAYYIVSGNEAAIIDPLREVQPYLDRLEKDNVTLKYIFETHFHADFVSGHIDLSKKTGAPIVYGPTAEPSFDALVAEDNQIFEIGNAKIKVLHTPGHTMESSTYLLIDEEGKETAIFSGDTLFLGDVGRPDLAQKAANLTQEELAGLLYDSLTDKILPLSDDITVYPAHGAGSACGKNMQKETVDTLGNQKKTNYALNQQNREAFIEAVLDGLSAPPKYFGMNVAMNKGGYESFENVMNKGLNPLSPNDFETAAEETGALILDTRPAADFHKGFVPNAVNIGLKGDFAPWVGAMIVDVKQPLLLVTEPGTEQEAITRLSRVGFDNVIGYLDGSFESWKMSGKEVDEIKRISPEEFADQFNTDSKVIDVRKPTEYAAEHVNDAYSKPLDAISEWAGTVDEKEHFFLHCAGGYRSMIAASILNSRGIRNFTEVEGGFNGIKKTGKVPTTDFICQSKL